MRLLFAITIGAFCAVLWVALALARRIQRNQDVMGRPVRRPAAREFFEAGEFRTPRPLPLNQDIYQQRPRRAMAEVASATELDRPSSLPNATGWSGQAFRERELEALTPPASRASFNKETGRITRIDSVRPDFAATIPPTLSDPAPENTGFVSASPEVAAAHSLAPVHSTGHRIPPSPDRVSGLRRRVDLSHYTKDMGDLTDPSYNHPRRNSGTEGAASVHRRDY